MRRLFEKNSLITLGAVCRAQELRLSDNLHSRSRSVRPARCTAWQALRKTRARSRPRC